MVGCSSVDEEEKARSSICDVLYSRGPPPEVCLWSTGRAEVSCLRAKPGAGSLVMMDCRTKPPIIIAVVQLASRSRGVAAATAKAGGRPHGDC